MPDWSLDAIRNALTELGLEGWLLYDFRGSNPMALQAAGLQTSGTRRWFLWIPAQGEAQLLIHAIERNGFRHVNPQLDLRTRTYVSWQDLHVALADMLAPVRLIAMEYSPSNAIPYVDKVDSGMLELVRNVGQVDVVSSADLVQRFQAVLSAAQRDSHRQAAAIVLTVKDEALAQTAQCLTKAEDLDEFTLQTFISERLAHYGLDPEHAPLVAVNANAADPHYEPSATQTTPILPGDMLLIDLWGRARSSPDACFADITWTAYCGAQVPSRVNEVFQVVRQARDACLAFLQRGLQAGDTVYGYAADDACRQVIIEAGFGDYFIHRTGHSLGPAVHFSGVNIDNLETQDYRALVPHVLFTVEPGIYLPRFDFDGSGRARGLGIRSEVNCLVRNNDLEVTTLPLQEQVIPLLA